MNTSTRRKRLRSPLAIGASTLALAAALSAGQALAEDKALLDTLLKNGIITNDQYKSLAAKGATSGASTDLLEILAKNGAITKDQHSQLAKKAAESKETTAKAEDKDAAKVKLGSNGLEFESLDGNFKAKIGGRIQVESQVNFNDPN